ncbi:protein of unknown function [Tenacibaculum sp. 190130A14a]|uniref:Methyltransferase type 11 domain-containing protein n=1 Tax=Tenacibaculum polynesiense TaxID=3137857 RepID=A0ABP1EWM8_9FLAO
MEDVINNLYDAYYADNYDDKFIHNEAYKTSPEFEIKVLDKLLSKNSKWLDVACGTGYFLSKFPNHHRAGLDLSNSMLAKTKHNNPNINELRLGNFKDIYPQWNNCWDITSSMWGAYCYVENMNEFNQFVQNISSWTKPGGLCFLPLIDFNLLLYRSGKVEHYDSNVGIFGGPFYIDGVTWSYLDSEHNKMHKHLLSPHEDYIKKEFQKYFEEVITIYYPPFAYPNPGQRTAFLAINKKGENSSIPSFTRAKIDEIISWSNTNKENVITREQYMKIMGEDTPTIKTEKLRGLKLLWHKTPEPIRKIGRRILGI